MGLLQAQVQLLQDRLVHLNTGQGSQAHVLFDLKRGELSTGGRQRLGGERKGLYSKNHLMLGYTEWKLWGGGVHFWAGLGRGEVMGGEYFGAGRVGPWP